MPRADCVPFFHFETRNVPSTTNALGIKGAGEAGTIGSAPAALNAVTDALYRAYGIHHIEMPATPTRIWNAIQEAKSAGLRAKLESEHADRAATDQRDPQDDDGRAARPQDRPRRTNTLTGIAPQGRLGGDLRRHVDLDQVGRRSCRPARSCSSAPSSPCFRCWRCLPGAASCARALSTRHPFSHIARGLVGVVRDEPRLLRADAAAAAGGDHAQLCAAAAGRRVQRAVPRRDDPRLPLERGRRRPDRRAHHLLAEADAVQRAGAGVSDREAIGVVAALAAACDLGGGAAAGAPAGAHREIGDHRAVVLADGQRARAAVDPVRLAGADVAAGGAADHGRLLRRPRADPDDGSPTATPRPRRWRRSNTPR